MNAEREIKRSWTDPPTIWTWTWTLEMEIGRERERARDEKKKKHKITKHIQSAYTNNQTGTIRFVIFRPFLPKALEKEKEKKKKRFSFAAVLSFGLCIHYARFCFFFFWFFGLIFAVSLHRLFRNHNRRRKKKTAFWMKTMHRIHFFSGFFFSFCYSFHLSLHECENIE